MKYQITKSYKSNSEVGLQSFGSVIDIYKDKSGLIWFGMRGGGVNIYNPKSELFRQFQISNKRNRLSNSKVRDIHEDKYGWIWIVTEGDVITSYSIHYTKLYEFEKSEIGRKYTGYLCFGPRHVYGRA